MNEVNLSKRLKRVFDYIPEGTKLADIGSDHAYLPCYAVLIKRCTSAIVGEITEGPYNSARSTIRQSGLEGIVEARMGDGLEVLEPNEVDVITIAGMGGSLISSILENGKEKLHGVETLILQPNIGAHQIRNWLDKEGYFLVEEDILEEDGKIYEILVASKSNINSVYGKKKEMEIFIGPYLLRGKNEAFKKKWEHEKNNFERILTQLESAKQTEESVQKMKEIEQKLEWIKEVLS
ncbi:class I SAM-dependent methyltransferase [Bacillus sp. AFS055030]|uniref:tRNA (adenine(22)-N(1))-methyltransferase n=1 Tax=Bacillus sp. AFS055030 TaxID=2033507 RepID=UPI000BFE1C79|nr:class I SAM-dependent methyltransferase [Bacillus sp. AFS055030]PGL72485.1 tRNA (adenine(22)-N(1))-methyltransferase TrmK [Bacillus sp. AFS055030]